MGVLVEREGRRGPLTEWAGQLSNAKGIAIFTCGLALRSFELISGSSAYISALCCQVQSSANPVVAPQPTFEGRPSG